MILPRVVRSGVTPNRACAPPRSTPEPGDDLVEDEQGAVGAGRIAQMLEELRCRGDDSCVRGDGLDDHCRDPAGMVDEGQRDRCSVVVRQHDRRGGDGLGHAGAPGDRQGGDPGAGVHEEPVRMPVIGAGELHHEIPAGRRPRQAQRAHHRLGARGREPETLQRRHGRLDRLAKLDLERVRGAEGQPVRRGGDDGVDDLGVGVAEDRRPPGPDVVDVATAVGIPDVRSLAALEDERRPADGTKGTHRAVDSAGEQPLGPLDERGRPRTHWRSCHHAAPSRLRISSIGRWIPSRIGVSLTVDRRLSVARSARTRSPNATRSSVS